MEMKIKYTDKLYDATWGEPLPTAVVCLPEVDALMAEAVWAMEHVVHTYQHVTDDRWTDTEALHMKQRAESFLARPDVQAWRERQKKEWNNDVG